MNTLYQDITDICFENGGVTKPMVDQLYALMKNHTVTVVDNIIGKEKPVELRYLDINEEEPTPSMVDLAVVEFQREQRLALARYQNPRPVQPEPVMHMQEEQITVMRRVDPTKNTGELVGVTGREEYSENEE